MHKYHIDFKDKLQKKIEIKDDSHSIVYTAKNVYSLVSNKTVIKDNIGNVVAEITRVISLIVPKYKIEIKDGITFKIKRRFGFCVAYDIEELSWEVQTDSTCDKYLVLNESRENICEIVKEKRQGIINYIVNIPSDENELIGICITIAIDSAMRAISRV